MEDSANYTGRDQILTNTVIRQLVDRPLITLRDLTDPRKPYFDEFGDDFKLDDYRAFDQLE